MRLEMNEVWETVKNNIWEPENEGDSISGILIYKELKTFQKIVRYKIRNNENTYTIIGTGSLDKLMQRVEAGSKVRITYLSQDNYQKNPRAQFLVQAVKVVE